MNFIGEFLTLMYETILCSVKYCTIHFVCTGKGYALFPGRIRTQEGGFPGPAEGVQDRVLSRGACAPHQV